MTLAQSGPGSDSNEGVLRIPQSSSITGTSLSDCLVSYPGHSLGGSIEKQLMYSTAPVDYSSNPLGREIHFQFGTETLCLGMTLNGICG